MYFSAAASSENDQGSMNLASNTAPVASTMPSRVAAIHGMAECLTWRWTSVTCRPELRSYQSRLRSSVAVPSWTMRLPERSSGSASPRFSRQSRRRAASSLPMMIRVSEPPMKDLRSNPNLLDIDAPQNYLFTTELSIIDKNRSSQSVFDRVDEFHAGRDYFPMLTSAQCRAARGLIEWSQQDLSEKAGVGIVTVRQFEGGKGEPRRATLTVIRQALEAAGVEFIDENGGGPGVRLRKRPQPGGG